MKLQVNRLIRKNTFKIVTLKRKGPVKIGFTGLSGGVGGNEQKTRIGAITRGSKGGENNGHQIGPLLTKFNKLTLNLNDFIDFFQKHNTL